MASFAAQSMQLPCLLPLQFRDGYKTAEMEKSAVEFLKLNGINDPTPQYKPATRTLVIQFMHHSGPQAGACACDLGHAAGLFAGDRYS